MLKWFLCILIIGAGAAAGYLRARPFRNRVLHLQDLSLAIRALEGEMNYRRDPLGVLLDRIGRRTDNKAGAFFLEVCHNLQTSHVYDFQGAWRDALQKIYEGSSLTEEDLEVLQEMGIELGRTDLPGQESLFARAKSRLEVQEKNAADDNAVKGRLYRGIYAAGGIMIVIVLL